MPSGVEVDLKNKASGHSHDLGYEIFLIMQGKVRGLIAGEEGILEAGQLCIAAPHETHAFEVIGDEDVVMYLSVTPHIQPTHTMYNSDGERLPHRFAPNSAYDIPDDDGLLVEDLLHEVVSLTKELSGSIQTFQIEQESKVDEIFDSLKAVGMSNEDTEKLRSDIYDGVRPLYEKIFELTNTWNNLAPKLARK
tara:strand:- start:14 stop:592 length:579 start_codon:yes stop_codon:yes gene_type:complete